MKKSMKIKACILSLLVIISVLPIQAKASGIGKTFQEQFPTSHTAEVVAAQFGKLPTDEMDSSDAAMPYLDLSSKNLTDIKGIEIFTQLETLILDNNKLTALPESIGTLTTLQALFARNNQLTEIPNSISNNTAIQYLYLSNNNLSTIPESLTGLTNMYELYLDYNQITQVSPSFNSDAMPNLMTLSLRGNQITSINNLSTINMSYRLVLMENQLTEALPDNMFDGMGRERTDSTYQRGFMPNKSYTKATENASLDIQLSDLLPSIVKQYETRYSGFPADAVTWTITKPDSTQVDLIGGQEDLIIEALSQGYGAFTLTLKIKDGDTPPVTFSTITPFYNVADRFLWGSEYNFPIQVNAPVVYYDLTFDLNGADGTPPTVQSLEAGLKATPVADPTWVGHTFVEWNTESSGSGSVWDFGATTMPANPVTLYAQWQINTYNVKFDPNGGVGTMADAPYNYGETKKLDKDTYTREGYTFLGWATTPTGPVVYADEANYTCNTANDITLYAQWQKQDEPVPPIPPVPPVNPVTPVAVPTGGTKTPATGDSNHNALYFLLGLMAISGLVLTKKRTSSR